MARQSPAAPMISGRHSRALFPAAAVAVYCLVVCLPGVAVPNPKQRRTHKGTPLKPDLAAWGTDHVGKPPPEYTSGDQCLFCHRKDVASTWARNPHNRTVRPVEQARDELEPLRRDPGLRSAVEAATHVLGGRRRLRLLKSAAAYGHLELHAAQWQPARGKQPGKRIDAGGSAWNAARFGDRCAGCHATGVDAKTRSFLAHSLDCGTCHGEVDPAHSTNPKLALLSPSGKTPARVVASICGSCHLRGGQSRSTGRPFPNNFVPGDNLFRDFRFDFTSRKVRSLPPTERHVVENIREASLHGAATTCLSCHDVHTASTALHRTLAWQPSCRTCHDVGKRLSPGGRKLNDTCEF